MKSIVLSSTLFLISLFAKAQNSLSFYHLGNATFQNSYYNPALIPEGKLFIGLPVLSGIHVHYNNKFNYDEAITNEANETRIDENGLLESLQKQNMVKVASSIHLFHLAYTHPASGLNFSFFGNERLETNFLFPKSLIDFVVNGNESTTGKRIKIGRTRLSASYFREIGVGVMIPFPKYNITTGVRLKYLQGFVNASTPRDFTADITTNSKDYAVTLDMHNATLQTSGVKTIRGGGESLESYLIGNKNRGMAIDGGMNMGINDANTLAISLIDFGFISWKEDIKNHTLGDTTMNYRGINLRDAENIEQEIRDSLFNKFKNKLTTTRETYTTFLSTKVYASWTHHLTRSSDLVGTTGIRYLHGRTKLLLGGGYRQYWGRHFVGSVSVTRLPQQFLNLGAAFAVRGGPAQMYLAVDQIVNYEMTKLKSFDFRFGINIIVFQKERESVRRSPTSAGSKGSKRNTTTESFLGSKVKVKKHDGIYTLIRKQKRRKRKKYSSNERSIPNAIGKPKNVYD